MSDFELINKAAHRIYPTHLKEHEKGSSFSWSGVLPTDAKSRLVKDSEGHKQTDDRNSHTLTHKLKGGASIEFNITQNGKNHIAMAKYHKGGKLYTAIHSHEDPSKAIKTAYDSVARRIVTEEAEIALIEKMEKRIEKKTGKLSDKKEKIDVEPSEEKELKEGTIEVIPHFIGVMPDGRKVSPFSAGIHHVEKTGKWTWGVTDHNGNYTTGMSRQPVESREEAIRIAHEVAAKTLHRVKLHESTPPGMESWVKKNKARFVKEYGEKKGHEVLYATAWKLHNKMNEAEHPTDTKQGILAQLDYHHGRENYHRQSAEMNHRKANKFTLGSENYKLYKNVAKGQEAIAKHHHKSIQDLHKKFATMNETEQLDELSPSALGRYIKFAAIDKSKHAAHGAISDMAMYNAQNRGDKKDAQREKERGDVHHKKEDKRTSGILTATDKLVRKAHGLHEASRPAPHPDKVVMTSSIRKDLGGGYMAKTRNGHFYKLDVNAFGEPGKGRELPKLGAVLDTSKHKFIGKDKVDLNLLKESSEDKNYLGPVVGKYLTHSGKVGMEIRKHPIGTYFYFGEWGAGGGHSKAVMDKTANMLLRVHPRHNVEKHYFGDVHNIKEDLDHDHPDMKAYHAACKARDEAHLASIRYRMSHDIKQPEHRAKYDELEAEHHRLRDIEDAAGEKINGRLFAHHATKK